MRILVFYFAISTDEYAIILPEQGSCHPPNSRHPSPAQFILTDGRDDSFNVELTQKAMQQRGTEYHVKSESL